MKHTGIKRAGPVLPALLLLALSAPAVAQQDACDRACLEGFIDSYLDALVARDPAQLPLAADVRFTENGQELELGDALWHGASGVRDYRVYITDPGAGQAALFAVVEEHGLPVLFSLRLAVEAQRITEIETIAVRSSGVFRPDLLETPRPGLTEILPPEQRRPREEMIAIADLYLDGLEQNTGTIVPFAYECERIENGMVTSTGFGGMLDFEFTSGDDGPCQTQFNSGIFSWITHITPRRHLVVDEERGIVFGVYIFNHRGDVTTASVPGHGEIEVPPVTRRPLSAIAAELFRIKDGEIHEVEAILMGMPYGYRSGW